MAHYPVQFDHNRFPSVPAARPPVRKKPILLLKAGTNIGGTLKLPREPYAHVNAVWLEDAGGTRQSIPTDNHSHQQYSSPLDVHKLGPGADSTFDHFHFVPGVDPVAIRWKVEQIPKVQKIRFELWTVTKTNGPIWTMEKAGGEAITLLQGPHNDGKGELDWSLVTIPINAAFPEGVANVANAPYQLRLTVTCAETGAVTTAWTYFDILVHTIELHWGPKAWIPGNAIANVSALLQARTTADELRLLKRLKGQVQPADPKVTLITPGPLTELRLPSTMAGYIHFDEWFGFAKDFAYLRHRARWGDGPRIPIKAIVYLKRVDGTKLDPAVGGATWNQAGAALGPTKLLWDWHDRPLNDRTPDEQRLWTDSGDFVLTALTYKLNQGDEPPDCRNCHFERGGKRGSPQRIFPNQNGAGSVPFVVAQCADRKWAAFSTCMTQGLNACKTGVLFNPSRMAKDSYKITVMLANQLTPDRAKPVLDVTTPNDQLLLQHPGLPMAETPMLEVRRQVNARYIRKGTYTPIDLNLIRTSYEVAGIHIEWLNQVDLTFTGQWTKAEYDQYLADAIAMNGQHFSNAQNLGCRFTNPNGRYGVQTNRYQQIQTLAGRTMQGANLLAAYDHWFGVPVGILPLPGQPSDTCFAFPTREVVVEPFKDQAIAAYIAKPRTFNGVLKKWNRLVHQNPAANAATLRLQLYNWLSASKRQKVDASAAQLYNAAGWTAFNQLNPNKWAVSNYLHTDGSVDLLAEMHQLKIAADAYEGVTFFHYINILRTVDAAGNEPPAGGGPPVGRYYDLGGVAKVDTSFDLGLKSTFFVWDHPNDGRRGQSKVPAIPMMDGNVTAVHEFGHNLHLTHPFGTDGAWNRDMHDKNPAERPDGNDAPGPADQCVMNYHDQDSELCGVCRLRLRGWAYFANAPLVGFHNTNPDQAGRALRPSGQPILNGFFTDLG